MSEAPQVRWEGANALPLEERAMEALERAQRLNSATGMASAFYMSKQALDLVEQLARVLVDLLAEREQR